MMNRTEWKYKDMMPKVNGKWIEFATTDYATRERQTRVLINRDDISNIKELYNPDEWGNGRWCDVFLKNGQKHQVHSSYEELKKIILEGESGK